MGRPKKEVSEEKIEQFQRELELAGDRTDILLQDKKGRSRSCLLCRRRKQRCDHKVPSCTACLKAGVKCVQPVRYVNAINNNTANQRQKSNSNSNEKIHNHLTKDIDNREDSEIKPNNIIHNDHKHSQSITSSPQLEKNSLKNNSTNKKVSMKNNTNNQLIPTKKDEYTKVLEKKLKYLEKLVSLEPNGPIFNKKLEQYKKISHLLETTSSPEPENIITLPAPHVDNSPVVLRTGTPNNVASPANTNGLAPFIKVSTSFFQRQSGNHINQQSVQQSQPQILTDRNSIQNLHSNQSSTSIRNDTSATPVATILQHNNTNIPLLSSDSVDSIDFSKCIFAKYNLKEFYSYDPAFEFDEELSRSFLDTFFTRLQFKYPLLDEHEIYEFHENYIKNAIYSYSDNEFHFCCGRMWLVYTIAACLHMTTGKYKGQPPVRYFSTAIRHITRCGEKLNYGQRIELLTLLVLYLLRTDRDTMILYDIISDVMRICKNELHLNKWDPQDPSANKKLRLFWCVYLLERMICVSVGRPYTVTESEIDLPFFNEDSFNTKNTKIHRGVHFINQSLKLRRIESNFVEKLKILPNNGRPNNSNKKELRKQLPLLKNIFHDLEVWRSNCVQTYVKNFENETLKLYYYRSVRLLIQPYLEALTPEDRLFRECQAAAGQICQLYKIFHQRTITGHSTPAVHTIFVAGVTLIYCMWLARNYDDERRKKLGDVSKHTRPLVTASLFSTMDDLRACSVCLYVMTERSDFARIFRDTFDQLMNATVGNLIERCGPNSSELIYMSNTGDNLQSNISKKTKGKEKNAKSNNNDNKNNSKSNNNDNKDNMAGDLNSNSENIGEGNNEDSETITSGMPPAMNRTFGKRQAEEHVGFVENSQVDLDEQKRMKQRRGMLEKISVPRSLSHLLTNNDSDIRSEEKTEEKSNENNASTPRISSYSSVSSSSEKILPSFNGYSVENRMNNNVISDMTPNVINNNNIRDFKIDTKVIAMDMKDKQYIVKKPINIVEFNWKNFEHQAFLQQHFAQQNLQAYLTAQNHWSGTTTTNPNSGDTDMASNFNNNSKIASSSIPQFSIDENNIYRPATMPPSQQQQSSSESSVLSYNGNSNHNDNINNNNNNTNPSSMREKLNELVGKTNEPVVDNNNSNNNNGNVLYPIPMNNNHHNPNHHHNTNNNGTGSYVPNAAVTFSSGPSLNVALPEKSPNPNDILFNNGTHDMINNISTWTTNSINEISGQMPQDGINTIQSEPFTTNIRPTDYPNNDNNNSNTNNNNVNIVNVYQYNQNNNTHNNEANTTNNSNSNNGTTRDDKPAEEFWRVNDDYGFLT